MAPAGPSLHGWMLASIVTPQRYARLSELHVKAEAERIRDEFGKILGRSFA
jgi:hypothetical protein